MVSFPVERDPFDEAECTKEFVMGALKEWISARNNPDLSNDYRARCAIAFYNWFIATDYVVANLPHATTEGKPYLIEHRLEWLVPGVSITPNYAVSPKLAVETAFEDAVLFSAKERTNSKVSEEKANSAIKRNPPARR